MERFRFEIKEEKGKLIAEFENFSSSKFLAAMCLLFKELLQDNKISEKEFDFLYDEVKPKIEDEECEEEEEVTEKKIEEVVKEFFELIKKKLNEEIS